MSYRILIPDLLKPPADVEQMIFGTGVEIILSQANHVKEISDEVWGSCDAILPWHNLYFDEETISKMKKCKVLVRIGAGHDNVDLEAAKKHGIIVCNVPDYGTNDVADHAMALILSLSRGLPAYNESVLNRQWKWESAGNLRRLMAANLGIIGLGRIGTATAIRGKAFGLNVGFYDPYLPVFLQITKTP